MKLLIENILCNYSTIEDCIVTTDAGTFLHVLLTRVADVCEVLLGAQYRTSEPNSVPLHDILENIALDL